MNEQLSNYLIVHSWMDLIVHSWMELDWLKISLTLCGYVYQVELRTSWMCIAWTWSN